MKVFMFGKRNVGDRIILKLVKDSLKLDSEYLGEKVDLSRIKAEEENIIIVINKQIFNIDLDKVLGYINKDKTKPLIVVSKFKTFGAIFFNPNMDIEHIATNKIYPFSGILYAPKAYLKNTISNTLREMPKEDLRVYIVHRNK